MFFFGKQKLVAIGASTGGVNAIKAIFSSFPAFIPPVVLVIHMQENITKIFANDLNDACQFEVKVAETGDVVKPNQVLIAPGGRHMKVLNRTGELYVECFHGEKVHFVIPSADVLFDSVAQACGQNAVGVILTGIGADGASGLLKMKQAGAETIGQNEETSVVYGMPMAAMEMGAVNHELPLDEIAGKILELGGRP